MTYLGDTDDHVFDKRFEGIDRASLLVAAEPHADSDEFSLLFLVILVHSLQFDSEMGEVFGYLSSWSLHSNFSSLCSYRD